MERVAVGHASKRNLQQNRRISRSWAVSEIILRSVAIQLSDVAWAHDSDVNGSECVTGLLQMILAWVEAMITQAGYPGLVLAMVIETVFPPVPSEAILPFAGILARRGVFDLWGVIVAATLGSVLGALILYVAGRWAEEHILLGLVQRYGRWIGLSEPLFLRVLAVFDRHGALAVFVGRLLPGLRSFISIPAGMAPMRLSIFLAATALGSSLWNSLFTLLGWWLGDHWEDAIAWVAVYEEAILLVAVVAFVAYAVWSWVRRIAPKAPPSAPT